MFKEEEEEANKAFRNAYVLTSAQEQILEEKWQKIDGSKHSRHESDKSSSKSANSLTLKQSTESIKKAFRSINIEITSEQLEHSMNTTTLKK